MIRTGGVLYERGPAAFWAEAGFPAGVSRLDDVWVRVPVEARHVGQTDLSLETVVHQLQFWAGSFDAGVAAGLGRSAGWELAGQGGLTEVAAQGPPYPLHIGNLGSEPGDLYLGKYGTTQAIVAPPDSSRCRPAEPALAFGGAGEQGRGGSPTPQEVLSMPSSATDVYRAARDQLLALRGDHAKAVAEFAGRPSTGRSTGRSTGSTPSPSATTASGCTSSRRTAPRPGTPSTSWPLAPTRWRTGSATSACARATASFSCSATRCSCGSRCSPS